MRDAQRAHDLAAAGDTNRFGRAELASKPHPDQRRRPVVQLKPVERTNLTVSTLAEVIDQVQRGIWRVR